MKKKDKQWYIWTAAVMMAFYIVFVLVSTVLKLVELGSFNIILVFNYMISSTSPVCVGLVSLVFAGNGIWECSKLRTKFPKWRAVLDIIFGGVGFFVICVYAGEVFGGLSEHELYSHVRKIIPIGTVLICFYWARGILASLRKKLDKRMNKQKKRA